MRSTSPLLCLLLPAASGFTVGGAGCAAGVRMQTLVPEAPTRDLAPLSLPETWVVPDTFTFGARKSEEPPFFKLSLFKSSRYDREEVTAILIKVMGLEEPRAQQVAKQAQTLGFAVVGEFVQEVAENYAASLKDMGLVVDVSPVA